MSYGFDQSHFNIIQKGIALFNAQEYWECHEELEHHWLENLQDPVRNIYWAIIQIAASMIHYRDGNIVGARGLLLKARDKIKKCHELNIENEFLYQSINWKEFKNLISAIYNVDELNSYRPLFEFRFIVNGVVNENE